MNPARLRSTLANLTTTARHVLDCVPTDEPIKAQQVFVVLKAHGHNVPFSKVQGCLKDLTSQKLLTRFPHDTFQRSV